MHAQWCPVCRATKGAWSDALRVETRLRTLSRYDHPVATVHRLPQAKRRVVLQRVTQALAEQHGIEFAHAYGSFVDGPGFRDIDVAIWTTADAMEPADLSLGIALTRIAGYPVDVRIINQAPVPFLFHVLRGQPLIVRDERHLADLIESTARIYHDRMPLTRQAVREAFAG
jgi:uncharacterized protein